MIIKENGVSIIPQGLTNEILEDGLEYRVCVFRDTNAFNAAITYETIRKMKRSGQKFALPFCDYKFTIRDVMYRFSNNLGLPEYEIYIEGVFAK